MKKILVVVLAVACFFAHAASFKLSRFHRLQQQRSCVPLQLPDDIDAFLERYNALPDNLQVLVMERLEKNQNRGN